MKIVNRNNFDMELSRLNKMVIEMATLIEVSFDETISLLQSKESGLANSIIQRDDKIDEMEMQIETECIKLIYSQQPVASDLRFVTSILKLVTDLERIGDNCSDISEYILQIEGNHETHINDLIQMAKKVKEMFTGTIDCYINLNSEKAIQITKEDDIVDKYFLDILFKLQNAMKENKDLVELCTCYIFIIKYLERMADHCCNICEWIAYRVTGIHDAHM